MNERIVVGMDIGTTKVCAVVASADDLDRINILGVGVAESEGLNRGVVVNIDKTVAALQEAVHEAERAAGVTVRNLIVGIAGDHVQSFQSRGVVTISHRDAGSTLGLVHRLLQGRHGLVDVDDDASIESFGFGHPHTKDVDAVEVVRRSDDGTHLRGANVHAYDNAFVHGARWFSKQ